MSAESDVAQAVAAQWDAQFLDTNAPGGLHLNQLPKGSALPALPYVIYTVKRDRPNKWAMRTYTAYTRVTFDCYDVNVLGPLVSAIHAAFDWENAQTNVVNKLTIANSAHLYTEIDKAGDGEVITALERNGQKILRGTVSFVIWTQRFGG